MSLGPVSVPSSRSGSVLLRFAALGPSLYHYSFCLGASDRVLKAPETLSQMKSLVFKVVGVSEAGMLINT